MIGFIILYPYAREFYNPKFGAVVLDKSKLLYRIHKAVLDTVSEPSDKGFQLILEGNLDGIVASGYGSLHDVSDRTHFYYDGQAAYLDRSKAYPPQACIVTIMERGYFLKSHGYLLDDTITHVIYCLIVIHGHEDDLTDSIPVQG